MNIKTTSTKALIKELFLRGGVNIYERTKDEEYEIKIDEVRIKGKGPVIILEICL